ncbi:MAG: ABC transporter permease [Chloroflexota bacterium]
MEQFIATTLRSSTPVALAALGCVFAWRAGIFHLGIEGLMLIGALSAVVGTVATGSVWIGLFLAVATCLVASTVFWIVIVPMKANAIIAGLGLSILGLGLTSYSVRVIYHASGAIWSQTGLWRPVTGATVGPAGAVSELSITVWLLPFIALSCWWILHRTRFGLRLAAVGEYPFAARSAGTSPAAMRLVALLVTGALCGLAGADLALGSLNAFLENMTSGRGYIAFTAVIFGAGDPIGAVLASLFFGLADAAGIQTQLVTQGLPVPREFILMLPYLLTVLAVWASSATRGRGSQMSGAFSELREG